LEGVGEFEGVGVAVTVGVCEYMAEALELIDSDLFDDKEAVFVCIEDTSGLNVAETLGNIVLVYNSEPDTLTDSLTREVILNPMLEVGDPKVLRDGDTELIIEALTVSDTDELPDGDFVAKDSVADGDTLPKDALTELETLFDTVSEAVSEV
jgi:hypothetical protein